MVLEYLDWVAIATINGLLLTLTGLFLRNYVTKRLPNVDEVIEKAGSRIIGVAVETVGEVLQDPETLNPLLSPVWDYMERRVNLKLANWAKENESEGPPGGLSIPGGLGAFASFLPPSLAQFAPLLGMLGGGGGSNPAGVPSLAPTSSGKNPFEKDLGL